MPVQVNGKLRGKIFVTASIDEEAAFLAALNCTSVKDALNGREPKRVVFIPGRALNIVV